MTQAQGGHILVVDDVEKNARLLADVLGVKGFRTRTALSGEAALQDVAAHPPDYFLHSYYFDCVDPNDIVATTSYGMEFAAIVNRGNIFGIQCHPEKSHEFGIAILKNFSEL